MCNYFPSIKAITLNMVRSLTLYSSATMPAAQIFFGLPYCLKRCVNS